MALGRFLTVLRGHLRAPGLPTVTAAVLFGSALLVCGLAGPAVAAEVEAPEAPLELQEAVLEQRDVRMYLRVATRGAWAGGAVGARRLPCVTLVHGAPRIPRGSICVTVVGHSVVLSYLPLAADGTAGPARRLAASVSRPRSDRVEATFLPAAAGLFLGPLSWSAQTAWTDHARCAAGCSSRLPRDGTLFVTRIGLLGYPPCFGAAARDPRRACVNPDLRATLEPPLSRAKATLDPFCDELTQSSLVSVCGFGASSDDAAGTFALLGDSHAASMKTALHVVGLAKRWRGFSIVRASCPATLTPAPVLRTPSQSRQCVRWNRQALTWIARQPDPRVVFLSANAGAQATAPGSQANFETVRIGYRNEIRALLRLAQRVVVIRDTPSSAIGHLSCVARALGSRRPPGTACAIPRAGALRPDPLAAAAQRFGSARVQVIDLTRHYCDRERCFPVVGGALVHRDQSHVTPAFSASLGPYILRALEE